MSLREFLPMGVDSGDFLSQGARALRDGIIFACMLV